MSGMEVKRWGIGGLGEGREERGGRRSGRHVEEGEKLHLLGQTSRLNCDC